MATYAIGDLQGCAEPFMKLLDAVAFDARRDRLWLVGDLVNRGPDSLEVLRWCYAHRNQIVAVLGNHDLYLLARAAGAARIKGDDTLDDVLCARDALILLQWLRERPLVYREEQWLMVHAGLHPKWTVEDAEIHARDLEKKIRSGDPEALTSLLQKGPPRIDAKTSKADRRRFALRVMTRMRLCRKNGALDDGYKGPVEHAPAGLVPWFASPKRVERDVTIVFGHWSALGHYVGDGVVGLDSGCVWGGALTAMRLEDREVFSVDCSGG